MVDDVLREQIEYYRARADEYDEWFERRGIYDLGAEWNAQWEREVAEVEAALATFAPTGRVLELACGTGWWTERLAPYADDLTCVDASDETIAHARRRAPDASFIVDDIFGWEPDRTYDVMFFSFWLSHVPTERFAWFWTLVDRALAPDGRVFFIDNLRNPSASAAVIRTFLQHDTAEDGIVVRKINDGRAFRAVKIYYDPSDLRTKLGDLGWNVEIVATESSFYYGWGARG